MKNFSLGNVLKTQLIGLFTILFLSISFFSVHAQLDKRVSTDVFKNTVVISAKADVLKTGKTFTDANGFVYDVYQSSRGNLFYYKTSRKSGKDYKVYIKANKNTSITAVELPEAFLERLWTYRQVNTARNVSRDKQCYQPYDYGLNTVPLTYHINTAVTRSLHQSYDYGAIPGTYSA